MGTMVLGLIQGMRLSRVCPWQGRTVADMTDIQAKIQQIAAVLGQLEDTQVPREHRAHVEEGLRFLPSGGPERMAVLAPFALIHRFCHRFTQRFFKKNR